MVMNLDQPTHRFARRKQEDPEAHLANLAGIGALVASDHIQTDN
jgi:hypothetical protein